MTDISGLVSGIARDSGGCNEYRRSTTLMVIRRLHETDVEHYLYEWC